MRSFAPLDRPTIRVDENASAAIIRANKPLATECCNPVTLADCYEPTAKEACCGAPSADAQPNCG